MGVVQHWFGALVAGSEHFCAKIRVQFCKVAKHASKITPEPSAVIREVKKVSHGLLKVTLKAIRVSDVSSADLNLPLQLPPHVNPQLRVQRRRQAALSHQGKGVQDYRCLHQPHQNR